MKQVCLLKSVEREKIKLASILVSILYVAYASRVLALVCDICVRKQKGALVMVPDKLL